MSEFNTLQADIALLHDFVHGADAVLLGGVSTPSLRALVSDIRAGVDGLTSTLAAYESRLARLERMLAGFDDTILVDGVPHIIRPIGTFVATGDVPPTIPQP